MSDLHSADAAASNAGKLTDARVAALAEALVDPYEHQAADPEYGIGGTCRACGEDTLWMRDALDGAAAILAALPDDWCGHAVTGSFFSWTCPECGTLVETLVRLEPEIARLRRIEEAARVAAAEDCQSPALDALRAALEDER